MTTETRPKAPPWLAWVQFFVLLGGVIAFSEIRRVWGWLAALGSALLLWAILALLAWFRRRYA